MKSTTKNLTEGPILKSILLFTLPMLLGNVFQQFYNLVDSAIVGRFLGADALAAVGATGSITYFFYSFCLGLGTGAGVLAAQSFGAKDETMVRKVIWNSAWVTALFGIGMSIISVALARPVLILLNTPESVLDAAVGYMRIACAGTLAVAAYNWIAFLLRALGDSRTPLVFLIISSILNVGLDLFLILVIPMGPNGAALATVLSQAISAIGSILYAMKKNPYFKPEKKYLQWNGNIAKNCVTTGVPLALQSAIISVSMISLQRVANGFGKEIMAAYTASMRVEQLIHQPYASLGSAMSTFTGQNVGARKEKRIRKCYYQCILAVVVFSAVMLGVFMIFAPSIARWFVSEQNVVNWAAKGLRLSCCFYLALGLIYLTRGLLNGAGDVNFALMNGICEVVGRIGFAPLLVYLFHMGGIAVWCTTCLTWIITMLLCVWRYFRGKWKQNLKLAISE